VLFDVSEDFAAALAAFYRERCRIEGCGSAGEMAARVEQQSGDEHVFGVVSADGYLLAYVADPPSNLAVGTLQTFLDDWGERGGFGRIDYVHGKEVVERVGALHGNLGLYLPPIRKADFFKTVILDGAMPRKTFSMGEAREKRFYMEARRIAKDDS